MWCCNHSFSLILPENLKCTRVDQTLNSSFQSLVFSKVLCWVFLFKYLQFPEDPHLKKKASPIFLEHICPLRVGELPVNDTSQSLSLLACYTSRKSLCVQEKSSLFVESQMTQTPLPSQYQVNFPQNRLNSALWERFVVSSVLSHSNHVDGPTKKSALENK